MCVNTIAKARSSAMALTNCTVHCMEAPERNVLADQTDISRKKHRQQSKYGGERGQKHRVHTRRRSAQNSLHRSTPAVEKTITLNTKPVWWKLLNYLIKTATAKKMAVKKASIRKFIARADFQPAP